MADAAGRIVGGIRLHAGDGRAFLSADELRQYLSPSNKSSSYATAGVQENFQDAFLRLVLGPRMGI